MRSALYNCVPAFIDLTRKTYGRWVVVKRSANRGKKVSWWCRCVCGKEAAVAANSLTSGRSTSCGCLRVEQLVVRAHQRKAIDPVVLETRRKKRAQKEYQRHLSKKYQLTPDQFTVMLTNQKQRCAICTTSLSFPHVDHCHTSGKVRGLLCRSCNLLLGFADDDPQRLHQAISYLEKHQ